MKYFGVSLDNARTYSPHSEQVCGKADAFVSAIRNLLLNVNGPNSPITMLYYGWYGYGSRWYFTLHQYGHLR